MPVSSTSRYSGLPVFRVRGRLTLGQRLIEPADDPPVMYHQLVEGETLDLLALRYYGREDLWWRIADANPARFPGDWQTGETLRIPLGPQVTRREPAGR